MTIDERRVLWRENSRRYRERHRARVRAASRERYRRNPQKAMAKHRRWLAKVKQDPEREEDRRLKQNTLARKSHTTRRLRRDHEKSGGRSRPDACDLCGGGGRIYFDHCHESGEFRGWLCIHCNLALGHVKDDPSLLRKLASYLEVA